MRGEYHLEDIRDQEGTPILQRPSINTFAEGNLEKWVEPHVSTNDFVELCVYRTNIPALNPVHTNVEPNDPQRPARPIDRGPNHDPACRYDWRGMFQPLRDEHCPCFFHGCCYTGNAGHECTYRQGFCTRDVCHHDENTNLVHVGGLCGYEFRGEPCPTGRHCRFIHNPMNKFKGLEHRYFHHRSY